MVSEETQASESAGKGTLQVGSRGAATCVLRRERESRGGERSRSAKARSKLPLNSVGASALLVRCVGWPLDSHPQSGLINAIITASLDYSENMFLMLISFSDAVSVLPWYM